MLIKLPQQLPLLGEPVYMNIPCDLYYQLRAVAHHKYSDFIAGLLKVFVSQYPNPTVDDLREFLNKRAA